MLVSRIFTDLNFKAGKVHVFSDFDGTYFPARRKDIEDGTKTKFVQQYGKKMKDFFESTEGDVFFTVTTGRKLESYVRISNFLKDKNGIVIRDKDGHPIQKITFVCGTKKGYVSPAAISIIKTGTIDDFQYVEVCINDKNPIPCILRAIQKKND